MYISSLNNSYTMAKGTHSQNSSRKRGGPSNRRGKPGRRGGSNSHRSHRAEADSFRPDSAIDEVDADHSGEEDEDSGEESQVQIEVPVAMWVSLMFQFMFGELIVCCRTSTIVTPEDVPASVCLELA